MFCSFWKRLRMASLSILRSRPLDLTFSAQSWSLCLSLKLAGWLASQPLVMGTAWTTTRKAFVSFVHGGMFDVCEGPRSCRDSASASSSLPVMEPPSLPSPAKLLQCLAIFVSSRVTSLAGLLTPLPRSLTERWECFERILVFCSCWKYL